MKQFHFAAFTHFGKGHVHSVLPLCAELTKRGHRVTYPTNEEFAPAIAGCGAEPVSVNNERLAGELLEQARTALVLPDTDPRVKNLERQWTARIFSEAEELLRQVKAFYQDNVPDLILYDRYHFPGRILAAQLQLPAVQMTTHFAFYNSLAVYKNGVCENPDPVIAWAAQVDSFLSKFGMRSSGNYWHVENLNLHFMPKEFQHHGDHFDVRFCFTGALLGRPYERVWKNPGNSRPVILISGMTLPDDTGMDYTEYFGPVVDALAGLPCHCVLSIGSGLFSREIPPNFEVNRSVSHLDILPHASLFIGHGGMTSTLEALYHGVPALLVPRSEQCDEVAYRAQELGLAIRLPVESLSVETVRHTVTSMLNDTSLRMQVAKMRDIFKRSGGAALAADRIEHLLR